MSVISIDIGGTKTKAVLYDEQGRSLQEISLPSCHFMNAKEEEIKIRLQQCILDPHADIVIGYAGYARNEDMQKKIRQTVQEVFAKQTVYLMSDIDLAVLGTLEGQDGITVILGTGSVVLKKEEGNVKCYGGWGYLLGDEGSGYAIGLKALQTFVKQADGRMAKDELYQEIMWLYDMQMPSEIIAKTIKDGRIDRTDIAAIAKIVCEDACPSCHAILCEAAKEAAALILTAYTGNERVVITGGMAHAASYMKILKDTLQEKNCSIEKAVHDPVYGGYVYWKQCLEKK